MYYCHFVLSSVLLSFCIIICTVILYCHSVLLSFCIVICSHFVLSYCTVEREHLFKWFPGAQNHRVLGPLLKPTQSIRQITNMTVSNTPHCTQVSTNTTSCLGSNVKAHVKHITVTKQKRPFKRKSVQPMVETPVHVQPWAHWSEGK